MRWIVVGGGSGSNSKLAVGAEGREWWCEEPVDGEVSGGD